MLPWEVFFSFQASPWPSLKALAGVFTGDDTIPCITAYNLICTLTLTHTLLLEVSFLLKVVMWCLVMSVPRSKFSD